MIYEFQLAIGVKIPSLNKTKSRSTIPNSAMRLLRKLPIPSPIPDVRSPLDVDGGGIVHVAVGKSTEKGALLIRWTASNFVGREICLVHVHKPSETIPTLLGNMPARRANEEVVAAYRKEELNQTRKILKYYENVCLGLKVKMSTMVIESERVHKGIVQLVKEKGIGKLVMGAATVTWMNVKNKSKSNYVAKNASRWCEIWFINKDKHYWTRDAVELIRSVLEVVHPISQNPDIQLLERLRHDTNTGGLLSRSNSASHDTKLEKESLSNKLIKVNREVQALRNDAADEFLSLKKLEAETQEYNRKINAFELAFSLETDRKKEGEDVLRCIKREQDKVSQNIQQAARGLKNANASMALLKSEIQKAKCKSSEASSELKSIQASIIAMRLANKKLRRHMMNAVSHFEGLKEHRQSEFINDNTFCGYADAPRPLVFSLSDVEIATCNFSESFKLGQGKYGCVYKGEIMEKTVAVKQLYPQNMHRQSEFQQEVQLLGNLEHPNLVKLLGLCPEAWTLVYDYFPHGTLKDRLLGRNNVLPLTWKVRIRIISEIANALLFLHTSKPKMIIHGNLKPENILLDSDHSCKICDYGISMIVCPDSLHSSSFCKVTGQKGAFPHSCPEYERTGILAPKSDIYSFGVIILQLLTGMQPLGLVGEIRKAVSDGTFASVLQSTCEEWPRYVANRLADLGLKFCEVNIRDRPELTPTIVKELERLQFVEERPVPCFFQCPISKELMHDPQIAADGFSYDGDSLREWLINGRDTSPMTNLSLKHLELMPNHVLRKAIQDWVRNFCDEC